MIYLSHCATHKGKVFNFPVSNDIDKSIQNLASHNNSNDAKHYKKIAFSFTDPLKRQYLKLFKTSHWGIETKPWEDIVKIC